MVVASASGRFRVGFGARRAVAVRRPAPMLLSGRVVREGAREALPLPGGGEYTVYPLLIRQVSAKGFRSP